MKNDFEDFVNKHRDGFDSEYPDPNILQKVKERMSKSAKKKAIFISLRPLQWLAAASIVLVLGVALFWNQAETEKNTISEKPDRFTTQKEEVFYALNNSESATHRLAGALAACKLNRADKDLVDTLVKVMNTDANSNVRLASLDALSKFYREKYVKEQTLASLSTQDDPVVKTALIEFLAKMNETSITGELLKIIADETATKEIKDQAYSGLFKFNKL